MILIETLNKVGVVDDTMSVTFTAPDGEDDLDADNARHQVTAFLMQQFSDLECDFVKSDSQRAHALCICGAKLFDAIDNHDADPSDHDPNN